jgi:hypothetical protein
MSPIITLQRRMQEIGRIRMGVKDGNRPKKLETFRFTSQSQAVIQSVAALYGGTVKPWKADPKGAQQWEVISEASAIEIVVAPGQVLSQFFESWSNGGCTRRCDGETELLSDSPCMCPADEEEKRLAAAKGLACKYTSRFNCMVRDVEAIGLWRLESHGFYAATELAGMAELLEYATQRGIYIPATLRVDQRTSKKLGQTFRYAVPVVEVHASFAQVSQALGGIGPQALNSGQSLALSAAPEAGKSGPSRPALPAGEGADRTQEVATPGPRPTSPNFKPVSAPAVPQQTIREQVEAPPKAKTSRSNAAAPITRTGIKPRPAGERPLAVDEVVDAEVVEVVDVDPSDRPLKLVPPPLPADPFDALHGESKAEPMNSRGQQLATSARRAGIDEETRHALILWHTKGRTSSGSEVSDDEAGQLHLLFSELKRNKRTITFDADGNVVGVE